MTSGDTDIDWQGMRQAPKIVFIIVCAILLNQSPVVAAVQLPEPPADYMQIDRGRCLFVVPEQNVSITGQLVPVCDEAVPRIFSQLGATVPDRENKPIQVRVVANPADMDRLAPMDGAPPAWSGAVAYPRANLVLLALRHRNGSPVGDIGLALEHELSHLALRYVIGLEAPVPRWFSEGIAIQQSEASSLQRSGILWWASFGDTLVPLEDLERYPEHPGAVHLAYAEAADFVGFLLRRGDWASLREVLRRVAAGEEFDDALESTYGKSVRALEKQWREDLVGGSNWVALITGSGALWGLITALFIVAYRAVKKRRRRRLAEMEAEEAAVDRLIDVMEKLERRVADRPRGKNQAPTPPGSVKTKILVDDEFHTIH